LLRPGVYVQTIGQIIADGHDVTAHAPRSFEYGDIVAAAVQFVGAAEARNAAARNHYTLLMRCLRLLGRQRQAGARAHL
jgi:phage tail sheath gpL-like